MRNILILQENILQFFKTFSQQSIRLNTYNIVPSTTTSYIFNTALPIIQAIEPKTEEIKDGTKAKRGGAMEDVCVVDALSSLSHFNDTAVPLGCCR